jgi:hypothetical protein
LDEELRLVERDVSELMPELVLLVLLAFVLFVFKLELFLEG